MGNWAFIGSSLFLASLTILDRLASISLFIRIHDNFNDDACYFCTIAFILLPGTVINEILNSAR